MKNKLLSLVLASLLVCSFSASRAFADDTQDGLSENAVRELYEKSATYNLAELQGAEFGYGKEWLVLGLARGGKLVEEDKQQYLGNLRASLQENNGQLASGNNTDYSRVIIALTALGVDASNFAGYDLTAPLADFETTTSQKLNGAAYALLALDSGSYLIPEIDAGSNLASNQSNSNETNNAQTQSSEGSTSSVQATRERYVEDLVSTQLEEGGWSASAGKSEADATGIALQALAPYRSADYPGVDAAIERGLTFLSESQRDDGGYEFMDKPSSESNMQVIIALDLLGIDLSDGRFVKNGYSVYDAMMTFCDESTGSFSHTQYAEPNSLASVQGLYTLCSHYRSLSAATTLFDMSEVTLSVYDFDVIDQTSSSFWSGENSLVIAFLAAGVVVIALGVVLFIRRSQKKR